MYFVFAGLNWYPAGGVKDFRAIVSSIEQGKDWIIEHRQDHDWFHIAELSGIPNDRSPDSSPEFKLVYSTKMEDMI